MHQPDTEYQIETTVDGEHVRGTVRLGGSTDLSVRLESPSSVPSVGCTCRTSPAASTAMDSSASTATSARWSSSSNCTRSRSGATAPRVCRHRLRGIRSRPFLLDDPRYPRDRIVLGQAPVNDAVEVRLEDRAPYRLAPLLRRCDARAVPGGSRSLRGGRTGILEGTISDLDSATDREHPPETDTGHGTLRRDAGVIPGDAVSNDFLRQFARLWRAGDVPLDTAEIDHSWSVDI